MASKLLVYITPLVTEKYAEMAIMLLDSLRKHSNDERLDVCVIDDFVTHTSIHRWYTQH